MDLQKVFGSNKNDVESQMQPNVQSNSVPFYPVDHCMTISGSAKDPKMHLCRKHNICNLTQRKMKNARFIYR